MELLKEALEKENVGYVVYDETKPNPTISNAELARNVYLENGCCGIVGFGGGSAMDCAKAVGAKIAAKEANPIYPVPKLMNAREIQQIYLSVCEK